MRLILLMLAFGILACTAPAIATPPPHAARLEIPLNGARLDAREIIEAVCDATGLDPDAFGSSFDFTIDARSTLGRLQLEAIERLTGGLLRIDVTEDALVMELDRGSGREAADGLRQRLETWFDDQDERLRVEHAPMYGIAVIAASGEQQRLGTLETVPEELVVLVHGLDDPGWMWREMIPALQTAGHAVARFDYPNDGPIAESTDLFASSLAHARGRGVARIRIVAHSMGGLVSRDLLTRPAYYAGDGTGGDRFPAVDRLIMIGTPNHGSPMARLRIVSEIQEQISRGARGEGDVLGLLADGLGEAGRDLLPGSRFIRNLNRRAMPTHTTMTIIAGEASPVRGEQLEQMMSLAQSFAASELAPEWARQFALGESEKLEDLFAATIAGIGDGCVTVESARLATVDDFTVLKANHISLIVTPGSTRVPPAIPIVLNRLDDGE